MRRFQYIGTFQDKRGFAFPIIADFLWRDVEPGDIAIEAWAYFRKGTLVELETFYPEDPIKAPGPENVVAEFDELHEALDYLADQVINHIAPALGWEGGKNDTPGAF